jgi:hypothetical protein
LSTVLLGLLSFNRVFCVLLTLGGFGIKVFQNITVEWKTFPYDVCEAFFAVLVFCCCVSLLSALICENVCLLHWIGLFCLTELNWLLFYKGLLSFNRVFGVLLTPGGFGNKVFQNIIAEWKIFSGACLCVVLCRFLCFVVAFPCCRH